MTKIFKPEDIDVLKVNLNVMGHIPTLEYNGEQKILIMTDTLKCKNSIMKINNSQFISHELITLLDFKTKDFLNKLDQFMIDKGRGIELKKYFQPNKPINYQSIIRELDDGIEGIKLKFIKTKKFNTLVFDKYIITLFIKMIMKNC